jgi:hypothetical protein
MLDLQNTSPHDSVFGSLFSYKVAHSYVDHAGHINTFLRIIVHGVHMVKRNISKSNSKRLYIFFLNVRYRNFDGNILQQFL